MRSLYTLLWYLALPFLPLRLLWRGRREPGYRERIGERFGDIAPTIAGRPPPYSGYTRFRWVKPAPQCHSSTTCAARIPRRRCS